MATAFLKRQNILTNYKHYISSSTPNHNNNYNTIYKHITSSVYNKQTQQLQRVKYYSRFSNMFRRSGKDVEVPAPFVFGSGFSMSRVLGKNGFVGWYLEMIRTRPVLTKSITSSIIYIAADLTSQTIALPSSEPYDFIRTLRMAGYGLVILGPTLHLWFNLLSRHLPGLDLLTTAKKMALGQTVYGPCMNVIFFSLNAALQGEDSNEIIARLKRDFFPTMVNGLMYWPFCDFITFRFVPVHLQPLASNAFSYLWTVYMTYMASLGKAIE